MSKQIPTIVPCSKKSCNLPNIIAIESTIDARDGHDNQAITDVCQIQVKFVVFIYEAPLVHRDLTLKALCELLSETDAF